MLQLHQLPVLLQVVPLQLVDLAVVLLPLLLEMFDLLLEGTVPAQIQHLNPFLAFPHLSLQCLHHLLLQGQFVLHLRHVVLVSRLVLPQFRLQTLDFLLFLLHFLPHLHLQFLLVVLHPPVAPFPFLGNPLFQLVLLHLVEVPQLSQRFLRPLMLFLDLPLPCHGLLLPFPFQLRQCLLVLGIRVVQQLLLRTLQLLQPLNQSLTLGVQVRKLELKGGALGFEVRGGKLKVEFQFVYALLLVIDLLGQLINLQPELFIGLAQLLLQILDLAGRHPFPFASFLLLFPHSLHHLFMLPVRIFQLALAIL